MVFVAAKKIKNCKDRCRKCIFIVRSWQVGLYQVDGPLDIPMGLKIVSLKRAKSIASVIIRLMKLPTRET